MIQEAISAGFSGAPVVTAMQVIPVAGRDSMLLNLSGAHAPFFTRNLVILYRQCRSYRCRRSPRRREDPPDARGCHANSSSARPSAIYNAILNSMRAQFADRDAGGRGLQTFDHRITIHAVTAVESALLDLLGQFLDVPVAALLGEGQQRDRRRDARLSLLCRRPPQDRPCLTPAAENAKDDWFRLRHEEALTPETVVRLAEAAHARYGFRRLQTEGRRARRASRKSRPSPRSQSAFPNARITLDPNGAWSLDEAIRLCKDMQASSPTPKTRAARKRDSPGARSWRNSAAPPACRPRPT